MPMPEVFANRNPRDLRERLNRRFEALKTERNPFDDEARLIQQFVAPMRGRFQSTDKHKGRSGYAAILNNVCTDAVRTCANGLAANLINPAAPWFRLAPEDDELAEFGPVRNWLDFLERRIGQILFKSGFYPAAVVALHELVTFGTAGLAQDRDFENIFRWDPWTFGQYYFATDARNQVKVAYREIRMTVETLVAEFKTNVSRSVMERYDNGDLDALWTIRHAVEPWSLRFASRPSLRRWPYVSLYWDPTDPKPDQFLRVGGFKRCPVHGPRWMHIPPEAYGWGPVQEALGDVSGLQVVEESLTRGIERKVGDAGWQGPPGGFQGGSLNGLGQGKDDYNVVNGAVDIRPLIDPNAIQLADAQWYHAELKDRIRQTCHVNLFRMFAPEASGTGQPLTATETIERAKEKLLLGPVLLNVNNELLQPVIDSAMETLFEESREFWAQGEPGMLPIPPREIQGQELRVEYISELQQAQRVTRAEPILRLAAFVGEFAAVDPTLPMKVDLHQCADELAIALGAPPKVIRDDETVEIMLDEQRRQQQEQLELQQQQVRADTVAKLGNASTEQGTALGDLVAEEEAA